MMLVISKPVRVRARLREPGFQTPARPRFDRGVYRMELTMKTFIYLSAALLSGVFLASRRGTTPAEGSGINSPSGSGSPELEYLKAVNHAAPPRDPQLLFLLMAQYSNANMQAEGVEFLSSRLKEFGPRLT